MAENDNGFTIRNRWRFRYIFQLQMVENQYNIVPVLIVCPHLEQKVTKKEYFDTKKIDSNFVV